MVIRAKFFFFTSLLLCFFLLGFDRAQAAPVPLLKIDEPTDGQIIESYIVNLKYSLKNFTLKDYHQILKNNPNQGYLLIWLDREERTAETAAKYYKDSPYTFADVLPGKHTLVVELVGNDGSPFDPPIAQTIKFETKAPLGSEEAPLSPSDQPKVAETKTGEAPPELTKAGGTPGARYFLAGLAFLAAGVLGIFILKR